MPDPRKKAAARKKAAPRKAAATKKTATPRKAATPKKAATTKKAATSRKPSASRKASTSKRAPAPKMPRKAAPVREAAAGTDPAGFFVARVRGEDAVRDAPHPLQEAGAFDEEPLTLPAYDEALGELPWSYGEDALVALPRDPRTLYLWWDHAHPTLAGAFEGLDHPRAQLWLYVREAGWERVRVVDFALESRGYYLHDLEPGRTYRAEIHLVDRQGQDRALPQASSPVTLPPLGPSPAVDDRFVALPWDLPLPRLAGAGVGLPGGPFAEAARDLLARLSGRGAGGGPPTSPSGPFGGEGR